MIDSVFSLRFLLLIIGALLVAAIYLWGTRTNKRNTRLKYDSRRTTFEPRGQRRPAARAETEQTASIDEEPEFDELGALDPVVVESAQEPKLDIPIITREGKPAVPAAAARRKNNQMELGFDVEPVQPQHDASVNPEGSIIALYVRAPNGREFAGPAIVKAMSAVGLRHGEMEIFHHFGAGELRTETPLFSVANIVEPGHIRLQDIDRFTTPGLAMILQLPGPLEGAVAFELFLNTAQRLAEALTGDLYSTPQKLLDGVAIDKMRKTAITFSHAG